MKLTYTDFRGMRPALDSRLIGRTEAISAVNCDLKTHALTPFLAANTATLSGATRIPLGYLAAGLADNAATPVNHLHDALHNVAGSPATGLYEIYERGTCLAASVIPKDTHERVYFTLPGGGMYVRGRTGGTGTYGERTVGVAAPTGTDVFGTPSVEGRVLDIDTDESGFTLKWSYYLEYVPGHALEGQIPVGGTGSIPDNQVVILETATGPFGATIIKYKYTIPRGASHPLTVHAASADLRFIMYAELTSSTGRFVGTFFPTPSPRSIDTDAYIGGTLAKAAMGFLDGASDYDYCELQWTAAGDEYAYYRAYVFTYVTDRGEESAPSTPTALIAVTPAQKVGLSVVVSGAPLAATKIRIYRTETTEAGTAYYFVTELSIRTGDVYGGAIISPIAYSDQLFSVDLPGDTLPSRYWDPPPSGLKGLVLSTKGFYAGYVGSTVYLSELFYAYAWPSEYAIEFAGEVRHIARYGDTLCVFSDREIALIVGNTPTEVRKIRLEGFEALTSIYSTVEVGGLLYFATATGIAAVSGTNVSIVSDAVFSDRWWRDNVTAASVRMVAWDNVLYFLTAPSGTVYRLGLQDDSQDFVRLSDTGVKDLYSSPMYKGVAFLLAETTGPATHGEAYLFDVGSGGSPTKRLVSWRSRFEISDVPMAIISVRVLASAYPVTLSIYSGASPSVAVVSVSIPSGDVRKLPVMRRDREWSFEVSAATGVPVTVLSVEVGTSGRAR